MDNENDIQIDPQVWLQFLLAVSGDPQKQHELFERISQNSGVPVDKVAEISELLIQTFLEGTRSN
ncbi:MAG: hypothetical protein KKD28_15310 [Chloroflexi bacterium]|nr:hypothetical protein [Chloroflexota bacterium]MBU1662828.1 hypothetical protein [Chloroflexota bacterium]